MEKSTSRNGLRGATIVLTALLCYANSFPGNFHYDDLHSIVENPSIRSPANIPLFFVDPSLFSGEDGQGMYRPMLLTTYVLNHTLGGYDPWGFHLFNLLLHAACSLLVWGISTKFFKDPPTGLFCALLFAVHPLATEPVNYISSRSESLAAFFYLSTLLLHIEGQERTAYRYGSMLCYIFGLLTKSIIITVPATLWLYDRWIERKTKPLSTYLPYGIAAAAYLLIIQLNQFLPRSLAAPVRSWDAQLWTQAKALLFYAKTLLVPHPLNVEPQFFESTGPTESAALGSIALIASLGALTWIIRRPGILSFSLAWCGLVLLPTLIMPLNMLVNERRLYLPLVGFVWICGSLSRYIDRRILYLSLPLLALLTLQRNPVWQDDLILWQDAAHKSPQMFRAQMSLGKAYKDRGKIDKSIDAYKEGVAIDPLERDPYNNIGYQYSQKGEWDQAIFWFEKALERDPNFDGIYRNLGDVYLKQGKLPEAERMYRQALSLNSTEAATWSNFGNVLRRQQRFGEARQAYETALSHRPDHRPAQANLASIYYEMSLDQADSRQAETYLAQAARGYEQMLVADSTFREALDNLGNVYALLRRPKEAERIFQRAIIAYPESPEAYIRLAEILANRGEREAALTLFRKATALGLAPSTSLLELGNAFVLRDQLTEAEIVFRTAHRLDTTAVSYLYSLGEVLLIGGEREISGGNGESGQVHWREAREFYRQVASIDPHYRLVQQRLQYLSERLSP
jgi:protein O-mannosyl-transferase